MGRLATFLAGFFGTIFTWFSGFVTSKVITSSIVIAVAAGIVMTAYTSLTALIQGIVSLVEDETFRMIFWACWPANAEACLAACWGADIALFLWRFRTKLLALLAR
jgi:hypothetical protein